MYNKIFITLGVLLILVSIILSIIYIPIKVFAVIVSSIGVIIGTYLISSANNKLKETKISNLQGENKLKEELLEKTTKIHQLNLDKNRLINMKIDVNNISPIMKLGLLELDVNMKDYKHEIISTDNLLGKEYWLSWFNKKPKTTVCEYVGLMHKTFKAQFGIDLKKTKLMQRDDSIYISGIRCELQGILNEKTKWLVKEIRDKFIVADELKTYNINPSNQLIADCVIKQDQEFKDRLSNGLNLGTNEHLIEKMGQSFIGLILQPMKKEIYFVDELEDEEVCQTLFEFINIQNLQIDEKITDLNNKILEIN